jgi:NADPH:quinone reductase-like Zn-dependent oxidoreductase
MPPNQCYEQAAPGTEGAHYALSHIRRAKIRGGHHVLVYGATGAIGSAAVQLLKTLGAQVTAVCATPHLELVSKLGAARVIDNSAGTSPAAARTTTWCSTRPARARSPGASGC